MAGCGREGVTITHVGIASLIGDAFRASGVLTHRRGPLLS